MGATPKVPNTKNDRPSPSVTKFGSPLAWILLACLGFFLFRGMFEDIGAKRVAYSELMDILRTQAVDRVVIGPSTVKAFLTRHGAADAEGRYLVAARVTPDESLLKILNDRKIVYEATADSSFLSMVILWALPLALVFLFWSYIFRRSTTAMGQGPPGIMSFGKSRARVYVEQHTGVTFSDIAGVDEAADELKEVVEFLKTPDKFRRLGGRIPKGVLLIGPPGTGKTLLARAVAGEANVPFFSLSGSEFVEMFVGVGAARVRDLFAQATAKAPCIVFIDELDAIGKSRNAGVMSGHDEREQTLNQLLAEMDGFDARNGLLVLAATNRPETLDPALMRPGRFDRHVLVDRPDKRGRERILEIHARDVKLGPDVKLKGVAAQTPGFAGADLANIVNEAALLAGRAGREFVTMVDFSEAIERVTAGLIKKNRRINDKEKEIVAFHESGHALVSTVLPHADSVHKVSIIPRGLSALGYTKQLPLDDRYLMSVEELQDKIAALFGGRAAEEEIVGTISTGAANDVRQATEIARMMVCEYAMSDRVGPLSLLDPNRNAFLTNGQPVQAAASFSEQTARLVDDEVSRLVTEGLERARSIIRYNRPYLEKLAARLLTIETVEGDEVRSLLRGAILPPAIGLRPVVPLHPVQEADEQQPT